MSKQFKLFCAYFNSLYNMIYFLPKVLWSSNHEHKEKQFVVQLQLDCKMTTLQENFLIAFFVELNMLTAKKT